MFELSTFLALFVIMCIVIFMFYYFILETNKNNHEKIDAIYREALELYTVYITEIKRIKPSYKKKDFIFVIGTDFKNILKNWCHFHYQCITALGKKATNNSQLDFSEISKNIAKRLKMIQDLIK